jgi:dTDP-N-acetylfucosamine:lipid II N-acetylfucosaminyltransferase
MICHLMFDSEYSHRFALALRKYFPRSEHRIILNGRARINPAQQLTYEGAVHTRFLTRPDVFLRLAGAQQIVLHGLFSPHWILFLFAFPFLLHKCNWLIWGGDLYDAPATNGRQRVNALIKRSVVKRFRAISALVDGDYEEAVRRFDTKAVYLPAFHLALIDQDVLSAVESVRRPDGLVSVQVGNSADDSNCQDEILRNLANGCAGRVRVSCPLGYGPRSHAAAVTALGKELFGADFRALLDPLAPNEYAAFLAEQDCLICNHRRQQALGNIVAALYLGKKVYIRSTVTTYRFFQRRGFAVYPVEEIDYTDAEQLRAMPDDVRKRNQALVREQFSEEAWRSCWARIFANP